MFESGFFIVVSILVLGVLVAVHEFGHFVVAKLCGVGVLEFSLGFGKKLWRRKFGETWYAVGAIPLGGYVRMAGEDPFKAIESSDKQEELIDAESSGGTQLEKLTDDSWMDDEDRRMMSDESRYFLKKNFTRKAAIVLAGPVMNMIFGFLVSVMVFNIYGEPYPSSKPVIGDLFPGYPAARAGFKPGDRVLSIDGVEMRSWIQLSKTIRRSGGKEMEVLVERQSEGGPDKLTIRLGGEEDSAEMKVLASPDKDEPEEQGVKIGVMPQFERTPVGLINSVSLAGQHVSGICVLTYRVLAGLVKGLVSPEKVVGGPIAVFTGAAQSAKKGFESLLDFMVLLSVSLALFNILPIPVLDGGHLLFFVIEKVKGSPISFRAQMWATQIGLYLLITLMIFAVSNDILRLIRDAFPGS